MVSVISGDLQKMHTQLNSDSMVHYQLAINDQSIDMNALIGQRITLSFAGVIHCSHCGKVTNKSFQGFCYEHFLALAQADQCIMSPEKCHFSAGTCREADWGEQHCFQSHYVYLANGSGIKVGITRGTQVPTRWIDQGAIQAIPIARVGNRKVAGDLEVIIKQHISDKTNWRSMLKEDVAKLDMAQERDAILALIKPQFEDLCLDVGRQNVEWIFHADTLNIQYPTPNWPEKISSFNLDKDSEITGLLLGIKGQYLILDSGVLNVRRFTGYQVTLAY